MMKKIFSMLLLCAAVVFASCSKDDPAPESVAVTEITLNKLSTSIKTRKTETLVATIAPANATNKNVTWASSDATVATVSATGEVTAVKAGTATITATSVSNTTVKGTCTVTVTEEPIILSFWSGGNTSTGYTCDVAFFPDLATVENSWCQIVISGSDAKRSGVFTGLYTYNPTTGVVTVNLSSKDPGYSGPGSATLQFNPDGDSIQVSFSSISVDYGTYDVVKNTSPQSIAGKWITRDPDGWNIDTYFSSHATDDGMACTIKLSSVRGIVNFTGSYTFDKKTRNGKAVMLEEGSDESIEVTYSYDLADNGIEIEIPGYLSQYKMYREGPSKK